MSEENNNQAVEPIVESAENQQPQEPQAPPSDQEESKEQAPSRPIAADSFRSAFLKRAELNKKVEEQESDEPKDDDDLQPSAQPVAKKTPPKKPVAANPPKPDDSEEPKEPAKKPPFRVEPLDETRAAAEVAAEAAANAVKKVMGDTSKPKDDIDVDSVLGEDAVVIKALEEVDPAKYKGVARKVAEFKQKESAYRQKWEDENDGAEFNASDPEHSKFYARNEPQILEKDLKKAERLMIKREVMEEVERKNEPIIKERQQREIEERVQPEKAKAIRESVLEVVAELGDEFKDMDEERINKLHETDPLAEHVLQETSAQYVPLIAAAKHIEVSMNFNPEDPAHQQVAAYRNRLESEYLQKPAHETTLNNNGRTQRLVGIQEYLRMSPEQQSRHYFIGMDVVLKSLKSVYKSESKAKYQKFKSMMGGASGSRGNSGAIPTQATKANQTQAKPQTTQLEDDEESPRTGAGTASVGTGRKSGNEDNKPLSAFRKRFVGA